MRKRVPRLAIGSTHTLLRAPVTVFTVVEMRRVPNKRGTTSTIPVWRGACRKCGCDWDQPRIVAPGFRTCRACRGYLDCIQGDAEIPADVSVKRVNQIARDARAEREAASIHDTNGPAAMVVVHARQSVTTTKPLFTDR